MKLTIGERYHREKPNYVEELSIEGLESIDDPIPEGETVLPKDGNSKIEVRIRNNIRRTPFTTTIELRRLVNNWEKGKFSFN